VPSETMGCSPSPPMSHSRHWPHVWADISCHSPSMLLPGPLPAEPGSVFLVALALTCADVCVLACLTTLRYFGMTTIPCAGPGQQ
jgi:hypothetical protein